MFLDTPWPSSGVLSTPTCWPFCSTPSGTRHHSTDWHNERHLMQMKSAVVPTEESIDRLAAMAFIRDVGARQYHLACRTATDGIALPLTMRLQPSQPSQLLSELIESSPSAFRPPTVFGYSRMRLPTSYSYSYHREDAELDSGILGQLPFEDVLDRSVKRKMFSSTPISILCDAHNPTTKHAPSKKQHVFKTKTARGIIPIVAASVDSTTSTERFSESETAADYTFDPSSHKEEVVHETRQIFPVVLHRALAELNHVGGATKIATFLPDGKSFQINDQLLFEKQILPAFFPKMKSFASFQRQLNLYSFKRIGGAGVDRGAYRHTLFLRDSPALANSMKRTILKGGPPRSTKRRSRQH